MLPTDAQKRKDTPVYSGVLKYFPDALAEVAAVSKQGNDQHNPGQPLHWAREKSGDEYDALTRHLLDRAAGVELDTDGQRHMAKAAWRALAALQKEVEKSQEVKGSGEKFVDEIEFPESQYERIQRKARERDALITMQHKLRQVDDGSPAAFEILEEYEQEMTRLRS